MQGSLDQPPIVITGSRGRSIGLLLISVPLIAFGVFTWRTAIGMLDLVLFGFLGAVALGLVISPARLEVGPAGLTQTVLWRTRKLAWTDAFNFRPVAISLSSKVLGFDYLKPPRPGLTQGRLSGGWENPPEAVANLLNEARERWLVGADVAPQSSAGEAAVVLCGRRRRDPDQPQGLLAGDPHHLWHRDRTSLVPPLRGLIRYLSLALFIRVYAARLHDFGRSAWWQAIMYVLQFAIVIAVGAGNHHQLGVAVLAGFLVQLAFTIVLGVIPGDRSANKFGPPPDQPDLSPIAVSETFR